MSQLQKYHPRYPSRRVSTKSNSNITLILIVGLAVVVIYLLLKNRPVAAASYQNVETWKVKWDEKTMLPLEVEVHRDAVRQ